VCINKNNPVCKNNYISISGKCYPNSSPVMCMNGYTNINGKCYNNNNIITPTCDTGYILKDGLCYNPDVKDIQQQCPPDYILTDDGLFCVYIINSTPECDSDYTKDSDNKCRKWGDGTKPINCDTNSILYNDNCYSTNSTIDLFTNVEHFTDNISSDTNIFILVILAIIIVLLILKNN